MVMPDPDDRLLAPDRSTQSQARRQDNDPRPRLPSNGTLAGPMPDDYRSPTPSPAIRDPIIQTTAIPVPSMPGTDDVRNFANRPSNKEYGFLVGGLINDQTLTHASLLAWSSGTQPHEELISQRWLSATDYARAVAGYLGRAMWPDATHSGAPIYALATFRSTAGGLIALRFMRSGRTFLLIDAASQSPRHIARFIHDNADLGDQVLVGTRTNLLALVERTGRTARLSYAVTGLQRTRPHLSAGSRIWLWQAIVLSLFVGLAIGALAIAPWPSVSMLTGLTVIPFFCVVILRCMALSEIMPGNRAGRDASHKVRADAELPVYTILVPLFRETPVLPQLLRALAALDYPAVKLQILLILESVDADMIAVVAATRLAANIDVIVVPDAHPRTKPKAVNYALQFARGRYTVIYDAEDIPEHDQLRQAVATFDRGAPQLACLQAHLNVYNPYTGWFARQFAIEYSALFDALLPALQRLGLPIPLGGTSNHFRTDVLRRIGAWDPYNVTEDADLGIRLARLGWQVAILPSTTFEEAPTQASSWLKQRTRWLKGWMQTYLVHMRQPRALYRDLGFARFCGFHIVMGGLLLSALVLPLFYILLAASAWKGSLMAEATSLFASWLLVIAVLNLVIGYLSAMLVGAVAVVKRGRLRLVFTALSMPVYWLLISVAAYRALLQLVRTPYLWEKTDHKGF